MKHTVPDIDYSEYMASKPLVEAISAYASLETLKAYDACYQATGNKPKFAPILMAVGETLSNIDTLDQRQKELLLELRNQVLQRIKDGDLFPVGFKTPRASTDKPVAIALDMMVSGEVNWDKSEVIYNGTEFSGVRLLENANVKANKFHRSGNIAPVKKAKTDNSDFSNLNPSQFLNEKDAAKYLAITQRVIQGLRVKGTGPTFTKLGQAIRYKMSDLIEWSQQNKK